MSNFGLQHAESRRGPVSSRLKASRCRLPSRNACACAVLASVALVISSTSVLALAAAKPATKLALLKWAGSRDPRNSSVSQRL